MNDNPNQEDIFATNPITNLTANRLISSTHLQSKPYQSNNTNKQLADILGQLANTLNVNQTSGPNTNSRGTKAYISNIFSSIEPNKLNNFLFQCCLYFYANLVQFNTDIMKINFIMIYLTEVAQNQFEIGLNQENQGILQDCLSNQNLFVNELYQYFGLLDPIGKAANMLDNLHIKPGDKISTYNVNFICYVF